MSPWTIAHIPLLPELPFKSIFVFVAVMVAAPLDCIRSPLWLGPEGLAVLLMTIGPVVPSAVILTTVLGGVVLFVVLAALTASPPVLVTVSGP